MTVLTCPARREYFAATMASINAAGANEFLGEKIVFIDGTDQFTQDDWNWYANTAGSGWDLRCTSLAPLSPAIGTKPAMLHVLHEAAKAEASWLLYMEDDILLSKNAIRAVVSMNYPKHLAFVSFCDIKNVAPLTGITECPGYDFEGPTGEGGHWGNQMLVIQGEALSYLQASTTMPDWNITLPDHRASWPKSAADIVLGKKASDIMLGISLACPPAPWSRYGVFSPSLAQHVGERSLVNPKATVSGWGRDSLTWRGEDFDSLSTELRSPKLHEAIPHWKMGPKMKMQIRFRGGKFQDNRSLIEER